MRAQDFIIGRLQSLIDNFPQMRVRYEFDGFTSSHFIEVLPSSEFKENHKYSKYETNLIIDFIAEFPNEDIVFITENDLIEINNPLFVREGDSFSKKRLYWNSKSWSNNSALNFNLKFNKIYGDNIDSIIFESISLGGLFGSNNIAINPIKEEPIEISTNSKDLALAA